MSLPPQDIDNHNYTDSERLFLDANIWLYIYSPRETMGKLQEVYSAALSRMLNAKSQLFTDVLIISEFVNTYARTKWHSSTATPKGNFKNYRQSKHFKPVAKQIASAARKITSMCQVLESGFSQLQHHSFFENYATGKFDFNDQMIVELCHSQELTLVTHDGDFAEQTLPILTANQKLLGQKHTP